MTFGIVVFTLIVLGVCWAVFKAAQADGESARNDDDDDALVVTLLGGDDGFDDEPPPPPHAVPVRTQPRPTRSPESQKPLTAHAVAAARVEELKVQLQAGEIAQSDFDERRKAIIDSM